MTPRLFIFSGSAVLLGSIPEGRVHAHLAIQLIIALDDDFGLTVDGVSVRRRGAVVASNVPHLLRPGRGGVLMLLADPTSEAGMAGGARVRDLEASTVADLATAAARLIERGPTRDEALGLRRSMCELLAPRAVVSAENGACGDRRPAGRRAPAAPSP